MPTCWRRFGARTYVNIVHYSDVIMSAMASQITGVLIVCSTVSLGADQRKHQSSASLAFVWGIHRCGESTVGRWFPWSPYKGPVTRKCFHLMTSSWLRGLNGAYSIRTASTYKSHYLWSVNGDLVKRLLIIKTWTSRPEASSIFGHTFKFQRYISL